MVLRLPREDQLARPWKKLGLIAAPVVALYLPTVKPFVEFRLVTKSSLPNNSSPVSLDRPVMKLALIVAPVVASYLPTVLPAPFATKRILPHTTSPDGPNSPVMKFAFN